MTSMVIPVPRRRRPRAGAVLARVGTGAFIGSSITLTLAALGWWPL